MSNSLTSSGRLIELLQQLRATQWPRSRAACFNGTISKIGKLGR
jgi:hypothetical protein